MILTEATNLRVGTTQSITAALENSSFAAFWTYLTTTISSVISGTIGLIKYGTGTLTLTGNNSYSGVTTINAGTLLVDSSGRLGGGSYAGNIVNNGTFTYNGINSQTLSGIISGGGTFIKNNSSTLTLTGNNTYTGATTISAGVLNIRNNTALGSSEGGTTVASGAALQLQGNITVTGEALSLAGGGISTDGALRNISGNNEWTGNITIGSANTRIASDAGVLTLSGNIIMTNTNTVIWQGNGNFSVTGVVSGANTFAKSAIGNGTITLSGLNTFTGQTQVNNGAISINSINDWNSSSASAIGIASDFTNGRILLGGNSGNTAGALIYTGTAASTNRQLVLSGNLTGANAIVDQSGTGLLKFTSNLHYAGIAANTTRQLILQGSTAGTGEISGIIADQDLSIGRITAVTKNGSSSWTLSGNNTYTGATTITAGTLRTTRLISGTTGKFSQADFTNTTLTVTFSGTTLAGETYRLFPGATTQTYASVTLVGAGAGRTATYNSTNSTLTIA